MESRARQHQTDRRSQPAGQHPQQVGAAARWIGPVGFGLLLVASVLWLSTRGHGPDVPLSAGLASAVWMILTAGGLAAAYLAGAVGIGRLAAWGLLGPSSELRTWVQAALGVGVMLLLSHLLGVTGALGGSAGVYVAWGVVVAGVLLLTDQVVRAELRPENWPVLPGWGVLAAPGIAVMLVGAASPPGVLWASEAGGYDVLSYHLQLPKEWIEQGRLWPVEHNVYSFLPSYMEAAFMHLGVMGRIFGGGEGGAGYIAGDGVALVAAQMLHALIGVLGAALVGRFVWAVLTARAVGERTAGFAGVLAAATVLSTPWVVVVGSMAYNELAVVALGAGAMLVVVDRGMRPWRRGMLAGLLVGLACGAKPTAAFTVGPVAGLLLLGMVTEADGARGMLNRVKVWGVMAASGSAAALVVMLPWLVRNWLASGNPVFPFAAGLLGRGHWSEEQVERYAGAHRFDGGWSERLDLLLSADRGAMHPQWFILFAAGIAGLLAALMWRRSRRAAGMLGLGLGALTLAWMWLTHVQSRFLLPAAPVLGAGVGLGAAALVAAVAQGASAGDGSEGVVAKRRWLPMAAALVCGGLPLALAFRTVNIFLSQAGGYPNLGVSLGVGAMTYLPLAADYDALPEWDRRQIRERAPRPEAYANLAIDPDEVIYLIGDATPLYYAGRVLYHTTWDASPLSELILAHPGRADGPMGRVWAERLYERGVRYVLVNAAELERLIDKDKWYDPVITVGAVDLWTSAWCERVRHWPERGQYLFRLKPPGARPNRTPTEGEQE